MIEEITFSLVEAIRRNGPMSVFWATIVEQILTLIPSVLIPMSAGFLLIPQELSWFASLTQISRDIAFPVCLGVGVGSSLLYFASFYGGRILIGRFGKFFGLSLANVNRFREIHSRL